MTHDGPRTTKRSFEDKLFRVLIKNSTDAIQLIAADGTILYSSDSVKRVTGYTPKEISDVDVVHYLHPDDVAYFTKHLKKILRKPLAHDTLEYRFKHKNGEWIWVETKATNHLNTPGINAIVGNFHSITDRKQTEERLRENEHQFRQLSDLSPIAITVHAGGKILYLNKAGAKMIGAKSPKQIIGQSLAQFVHADYLAAVAARVKLIMESGKPTPLFQEKFVRLDGTIIDVDVISLPITYAGQKAVQVVIRDITIEKNGREALAASEQRLRFMAETMPQKIFTADADGTIDYVNPQWLEYSGVKTFEVFLKNGWGNFVHPDELEFVRKNWAQSVKTGDTFSSEMRFLGKDGVYRWHITRARAMKDSDGNVIRWFGSNTDIDDVRTSLEREHFLEKRALRLSEQRGQLLELNRAKDEFIALASHQLRTPATAVRQYLGMILEGYVGELSDPLRTMLTSASDSNDRQIHIINDLLQVARLDGGNVELNKERIQLPELLEKATDEIRQTLKERKQQIIIARPPNNKIIMADPIKLRMVFENLLGNASKYSYENTVIKITVAYDTKTASISITDHGVGIAKDNMDKLFKKFSRINNPLSIVVGGTGLGLYWAEQIIAMHGGSIAVVSKVGKGSTFTVTMPLK